jgi:hypothetical protein
MRPVSRAGGDRVPGPGLERRSSTAAYRPTRASCVLSAQVARYPGWGTWWGAGRTGALCRFRTCEAHPAWEPTGNTCLTDALRHSRGRGPEPIWEGLCLWEPFVHHRPQNAPRCPQFSRIIVRVARNRTASRDLRSRWCRRERCYLTGALEATSGLLAGCYRSVARWMLGDGRAVEFRDDGQRPRDRAEHGGVAAELGDHDVWRPEHPGRHGFA